MDSGCEEREESRIIPRFLARAARRLELPFSMVWTGHGVCKALRTGPGSW